MNYADPIQVSRNAGQRTHHFHGGLRLKHNKRISCQTPVTRPTLPEVLVVPLLQHAGVAVEPLVKAGECVLKGQQIGRSKSCPAVHAPTSGIVEAVEDRLITHASGRTGPCVVIRTDGQEQWAELGPISNVAETSPDSLITHLQECGLAGLGGAVFPTHIKALDSRRRHIHTLILNGAECEPYISCDEMLMREQADKIILGACVLRHVLAAEQVVIAIEDQMGAVLEALKYAAECADCEDITIAKITSIYPEGGERQLVQVLTGLEVPSGGRPTDIGLVCQNVATAAAVAEAVTEGKPLIERYVTVTGNGISQPRNLLALIGTPFSHLIEACGGYSEDVARLVVGGPMMGYAVTNDATPVVKAVNCILALTKADITPAQAEMPCIRCGECSRACPALLLPQQLHAKIKNGLWQEAEEYGLDACIECGCCDIVCPSHIPLTDWFRHGKGELHQLAIKTQATRLARERFEAREVRLLREKQAQEEKMAQRKKMLKDRAAQKNRTNKAEGSPPDA